jgi:hypothetical protein
MTLDDYFSTGPPHERPVFDAMHAFVSTLGEVYVEPVSVGVFLKKSGSWVELRPMTKWVALSFPLARRVAHPQIARKPMEVGRRYFHWVNLRSPDDLTDDVKAWLTESWELTP